MNYYAALDVSFRTVSVCVVDENGRIKAESKLASEVEDIVESHQVRALLSSRKAVLDKCIDLENEVRGLFKVFGIKLPPKLGHGPFDARVRSIIEADTALAQALLPLLDARLVLDQTFRELDNRTRKTAHQDPVCQRLMSAPGVGFITALTFKVAVDDPTRFKRSRTVAAHFGLTPRRFQSGETDNPGRISRAGDPVFLGIGLTLDPRKVPSPLIGGPVPEFKLPPVKGRTLGLASVDLKKEVTLVNVFASWCVACRQEHPLLMHLSQAGIVDIHGLNYKDAPNDASAWLDALGDPYTRTGSDQDGQVGIDWGVYGVPETFVIDRTGHIAYKHIGPVTQEDLDQTILPLVERLTTVREP